MSQARPPFAAMIMAMRPSATSRVASPVACLRHCFSSTANPSGSRVRASAAARFLGDGVDSSQPALGRITSAQTRTDRPYEHAFCCLRTAVSPRPAAAGVATSVRQSAACSAPEAVHRCCQVRPGTCPSQSSTLQMPRRTSAWWLALS
jgi:hypothetical protein